MGDLKEHHINVFVNDAVGNAIGSATVRVLDNDDEEKEEIAKISIPAGRNLPARLTLPEPYKSVVLVAEVAGTGSQEAVVDVDVGNYTFTFPKEGGAGEIAEERRKPLETRLLTSLGKIAGLAGIALGVFLLLFQSILKQQILPQSGLTNSQAYHIILALMILTFGIAAIGIVAWIMGQGKDPGKPVPPTTVTLLAVLVVAVLITAATVGAEGKSSIASDENHISGGSPPVPVPKDDKKQTGDDVIDSVRQQIAYMLLKETDVPEAKILEALTPLFTRAAFSCATTEDWGALLWAETATRLTLEDNLKYFRSRPKVHDDLAQAIDILLRMQNDASTSYGPTFSITSQIEKYGNDRKAFIRNLPPMMPGTPSAKDHAARGAYLKKLMTVLRRDTPVPPNWGC
jgi:hypothetical protein